MPGNPATLEKNTHCQSPIGAALRFSASAASVALVASCLVNTVVCGVAYLRQLFEEFIIFQ